MHSLNIGSCTVLFRNNDNSVAKIVSAVRKAELDNESFFGFKPKKYFVELVYSDDEYDKKTGLINIRTSRGGFVVKNRIIMFSPIIRNPAFDLESFFYHEINHVFYWFLIGSYNPVWFSEGMATYLMKTYKIDVISWKKYFRAVEKPERFLYYRLIKKKYYENEDKFYSLSFIVYGFLHKKFGGKKIIMFLKDFSVNPRKYYFEELFKNYFGFSLREAVIKALQED